MAKRLKPGDLAPDAAVLDLDGNTIQLKQLWQTGPVLLSFLRHFG